MNSTRQQEAKPFTNQARNLRHPSRAALRMLAILLLIGCLGIFLPGCESSPSEASLQADVQVSTQADPQTPAAETQAPAETPAANPTAPVIDPADIPAYAGEPYVILRDNVPEFTDADLTAVSFEQYSDLDALGRCGVAYACVGADLMPTEERGSIGQVKPSGWHTVKYDCVDGNYLYNRCHLIGYQLTAENANTENLITGTRYLNVEGMLPFENLVADYVRETGNHVLYRVTPIFTGENLVASGVHLEAESVEDKGESILFNVYCYNVQPGVEIDYASGESRLAPASAAPSEPQPSAQAQPAPAAQVTPQQTNSGTTYILNTNTMKFHFPSCSSVARMNEENKQVYTGTREDVIAMGYDPCGRCNP